MSDPYDWRFCRARAETEARLWDARRRPGAAARSAQSCEEQFLGRLRAIVGLPPLTWIAELPSPPGDPRP